jgi:hypothetical protein
MEPILCTIVSYNASAAKIYNAKSRSRKQKYFLLHTLKKASSLIPTTLTVPTTNPESWTEVEHKCLRIKIEAKPRGQPYDF